MNDGSAALLVLNYNAKPFLDTCLNSLLSQSYKNFKVYFIDNCSRDGSADYVKENFPEVTVIANSQNRGLGKGFNDVIKQIYRKFGYVGLIEPDVRLDKNWLAESIKTLEQNPMAYVCSALNLSWDGKMVDNAGGKIVNFPLGIFGGHLSRKAASGAFSDKENPNARVFYGIVSAALVKSETFEKFGFFDEDYFLYFEDIDFSWRILLGGGDICCSHKAICYHYGHGCTSSKNEELAISGGIETNLLVTYYKNLSMPIFLATLPFLIIGRLIMSLIYLKITPRITLAKINGVARFVFGFLSGRYNKKRELVQKMRKRSDWQVLKNNPGSLVSFGEAIEFIGPWTNVVKNFYGRGTKES